ncbi:MAG: zinc-dependent metalloprotease family protein [Bacteroidota bacterium]
MIKKITTSFFILFLSGLLINAKGQNNFFSDRAEKEFKKKPYKPIVKPSRYRTVSLDTTAFKFFLKDIPLEQNLANKEKAPIINIPMPDGKTAAFYIWESTVMAPELAAKFPEIKTYTGQGVDDKTATIKIDWTLLGFHAMILSAVTGSIFIDPYSNGNLTDYISYFKKDFKKKGRFKEFPQRKPTNNTGQRPVSEQGILAAVGTQLFKYDLAIACTHEYATAVCAPMTPTLALTLGAIVTAVNRMNQVYENELSVHFDLVAGESNIIFVTAGSDPFNGNDDPEILIDESQTVINANIGSANYDIGHTFSTGAGGLATIGCVCNNSQKAEGVTGTEDPVGDPFVIDYVCHEIGHQFSAKHIFNSQEDFCGDPGQHSPSSNAEPGSGSTIMGYSANPAICGTDNLQNNSDPQFHAISFNEIIGYVNGPANACATKISTGNNIPAVNAGADYSIPRSTPFFLNGTATDIDVTDHLTYSWEQIDIGAQPSPWDAPIGIHAPLFRSFPPVDTSIRYFPKLTDVINNTTTKGEILPTITRPLNFRLTARDNHAGNGGVNSDDVLVTVTSNGPFTLSYPTLAGVSWTGNENRTVTWDVSNTDIAPINANTVNIQLSIDGGYTYPITLVSGTNNDGSEAIIVPNLSTTTARIRIIPVGNIFYTISKNNFRVVQNTPVTWIDFTGEKLNDLIKLTWVVNEQNTSLYEIERSSDGINFTQIGNIPANNISGTSQQYTYNDTTPLNGNNYYRIKQIAINANQIVSDTVIVMFKSETEPWLIYPNPTSGNITIKSNVNSDDTQLNVYDAIGRLLYKKTLNSMVIGQFISVELARYGKGVYLIKIKNDKILKINRVVVQ